MKRKTIHSIYVLLLCASLLLYGGCTSGGFGSEKSDDAYKSGTTSLDMTFDRSIPPRQLLQEQQSGVVIRLQNEGAFEIENGFVTLNFDKSIITSETTPLFKAFSLEGKSSTWPRGEATAVSFDIQATKLPQESQIQETQFIATACYDYRTEVFVDVCLETDPYDLRPSDAQEVCSGSEYSPGSSGGNVNVKRVSLSYDVNSNQVAPTFYIDLTKSGRNLVYKQGLQADFCTGSTLDTSNSLDIIGVEVYLSDRPLICNTDSVKLIEGQATITCDGFVLDGGIKNYVAPLTVLLDYGVMITESKSVEVVRAR